MCNLSMARGPDGIKILYESNRDNPQSWYFQGEVDSRMKLRGGAATAVVLPQNPDGSYCLSQNQDVYIAIETNDKGGIISKNQLVSSAKGFMRNNRDWRSIEQHGYFLIDPSNDNPDASIIFTAHTADPYASYPNTCLGQGYHFQVFRDGTSRFAKSLWYPSGYLYTPKKSLLASLDGRWVGFKFVCIVVKLGVVKLEVYVDEGYLTNNWQPLDTITDQGGWGGQELSLDIEEREYNACGGTTDQVLDMGAPNVAFAWRGFSDEDGICFDKLGIREVGPKQSITDLPVQRASGFGSQKVKFGVQPEKPAYYSGDSENFAETDRD